MKKYFISTIHFWDQQTLKSGHVEQINFQDREQI